VANARIAQLRALIEHNQSAAAYGLPGAPSAQSIEEYRRQLQQLLAGNWNLRQRGDDEILQGASAQPGLRQPAPAMTGTSRDDIVNAINTSKTLTMDVKDYPAALRVMRALEPVAGLDPAVQGFYNRAASIVKNFSPDPSTGQVRTENGGLTYRTALAGEGGGGAGAPSAETPSTPAGGGLTGKSSHARAAPDQAAPAAQPVSIYGPEAFLPKPPAAGNLDPDYDIRVLQRRMAGHAPGDPVYDTNQARIVAIKKGELQPLNRNGSVNAAMFNYYRELPAMELRARQGQEIAEGYRGAAMQALPVWRSTQINTDNILRAGKQVDISATGSIPGVISQELGRLGITNAATFNARNLADYATASSSDIQGILRSAGIPDPVAVSPSSNAASTVYNATILRRAAAKMAADKAGDFNKEDSVLTAQGQPFTDIYKFNNKWNGSHPIKDYIRTEVHDNGFVRGMSNEDKMLYAPYLDGITMTLDHRAIDPKQPRGVQSGYYRMQNGIVKVRDGKVVGFVAQGR
jgi:hypothetical protein